jgi:hypothetical protein
MLFKKARIQSLASDFTKTDQTVRFVLFKYLTSLDDNQLSDKEIDKTDKDKICAMISNYLCGDEPLQNKSNPELVAVYKKHGSGIPKHADNIIRQNPDLLWIIVQYLRGRLNVVSALDYPNNPSDFIKTEAGQRIWKLLGVYGEEVKEAIDYTILKKRLANFNSH